MTMSSRRQSKYPVVYDAQTTYQTSYVKYDDLKREKGVFIRSRSEPPPKIAAPPRVRDNETLSYYRQEVKVPFNLLWERKPIVQTNPLECFVMPEKPVDFKKAEVRKTRPRLYMSPAVSIDDVSDPNMRELMLGHLYSTDWRKAELEAAGPVTKRTIPNSALEMYNKNVALDADIFLPIQSKAKEIGRAWDVAQMRAYVDPTRSFWLNKDPRVRCGACENPYKGLVDKEVKQQIADLIETNELRMPHDKISGGYTGYRPELSADVALKNSNLPPEHPIISVAQAIDIHQTK